MTTDPDGRPIHTARENGRRHGGCIRDLTDPRVMAECVALGLLESMPPAAAVHAARLIADGLLPMPKDCPPEWRAFIDRLRTR